MNLRNDFTEATRFLFQDNYECWICGENGQDILHHILGRISNHPLSAAPLHNFKCHIGNGKLGTDEMKSKLLQKTLKYFIEQGYTLEQKDKEFIEKYKMYY